MACSLTLKMDEIFSSEMSVNVCRIRRHYTQNITLHCHIVLTAHGVTLICYTDLLYELIKVAF
jgi:hypothetical protein